MNNMEAILDGSFMLHGIRNGIDFLSQLEEQGFKIKIPREVLQELKDAKLKLKPNDRLSLNILFELLEKRKIKKLGLGQGRIDLQLIKLGREGAYIATMDNAIRRSVKNSIIISNNSKQIVVERK